MEHQMSYPSDGISIHEISTGDQSAGNGGTGTNNGDISSTPTITFDPSNFATGATVTSTAGDTVTQDGSWDASGATGTGGPAFAGFGIGGPATGGEGEGGGTTGSGTGGAATGANGLGGGATGGLGAASGTSSGDVSNSSGHDTSVVTANTTATQTNFLSADMHQTAMAGIGGAGGSGNTAHGGDVSVDPVSMETTTTTLSNLLNNAEHFSVDDFAHIA
jgi:hypothetical protein